MTFARNGADGVRHAVKRGGTIQPQTLEKLLQLLREKTSYECHVAVEVLTPTMLKTIDNEDDAVETIRRLESAPAPKANHCGSKACADRAIDTGARWCHCECAACTEVRVRAAAQQTRETWRS